MSALPPMPGQLAPMPGQTMPGRGPAQTVPGRESGQTVLRARDRGLVPGSETEPPIVSRRAGRDRAKGRRRAAFIALPAALVIVIAVVGLLLTHSLPGVSSASDARPLATRDASLLGQPTPADKATRSATSSTPTRTASQVASPAGGSVPANTPASAPRANPAAAPAPASTPQISPPSGSPVAAATPPGDLGAPCGTTCIALYSPFYGDSEVLGVIGDTQYTGQPVDFQSVSNSPNENWVVAMVGPVSTFYNSGLVSAAIDNHYRNNEAYEYQYAPYGVYSGLCLGVSGTAQNGTPVTLQPCGVSSRTVWVSDAAEQYGSQVPLINGTDTNFTQPIVLTAGSTSANITTSTLGTNAGDGQFWSTGHWA
jgi:hypothetical protein